MRLLILFISFLISGIANGQILNASAPYRVRSGCATKLLDAYSGAAAAYSLRKLDADYAGSAIRVRRSSDNTEQDIGFVGCGDLDTASLKTFVGTGGTDDGFVVTWYDQSGNSRDATQATAGSQPKIMDNGVVYRLEGMPTIYFNGSNNLIHTIPFITGDYSAFVVASVTAAKITYTGLFSLNGTSAQAFMMLSDIAASSKWGTYGGANKPANTDLVGAGAKLICMVGTINSSGTFYLNSASDGTYSASEGQSERHIGGSLVDIQGLTGYISEVNMWNSSPSRTGVDTNINSYYTIY